MVPATTPHTATPLTARTASTMLRTHLATRIPAPVMYTTSIPMSMARTILASIRTHEATPLRALPARLALHAIRELLPNVAVGKFLLVLALRCFFAFGCEGVLRGHGGVGGGQVLDGEAFGLEGRVVGHWFGC
jgi:hypothetical protein